MASQTHLLLQTEAIADSWTLHALDRKSLCANFGAPGEGSNLSLSRTAQLVARAEGTIPSLIEMFLLLLLYGFIHICSLAIIFPGQGYLTHGRIDGPVPPKKQREFELAQARLKRKASEAGCGPAPANPRGQLALESARGKGWAAEEWPGAAVQLGVSSIHFP